MSNMTHLEPRRLLSKVPEVTIYFWIIKVLCTTVGETAADFLNTSLGFGLTGTSIFTGVVLILLLVAQFRAPRYVPGLYWATVALVSVFGTLITDNLTDNLGVPLQTSTLVFGIALPALFAVWYASERTLAMHSIVTSKREAFYWLAVLLTFALGTATGDLMSEALSLGYLVSALIVAGIIAIFTVAWRLGLNAVLGFWLVYILTRPLGASLGDLLSQPHSQGGLGLGPTATSVIFLVAILGTVVYLTKARPDVISRDEEVVEPIRTPSTSGLIQTVAVVAVVVIAAGVGYNWRKSALADEATGTSTSTTMAPIQPPTGGGVTAPTTTTVAAPNARLGDLSQFRTITQDTLNLLDSGNQSAATARVTDLETAWDNAQGRLQARDKSAWTRIDAKIDTVLSSLRAKRPDPSAEKTVLNNLLTELR